MTPVAALLFMLLATAPQAPPAPSSPIIVTAHPWAPFISPMGEPFRAHSTSDDTLANWFAKADANHDGLLTPGEMQADADRFFATLDADHDGEIGPEEIVNYEWEVAPEIQVNSRTRRQPGDKADNSRPGLGWRPGAGEDDLAVGRGRPKRRQGGFQGAARYGLLNIPEPVAAADTDFNRGISRAEFREAALARFQLLDSAHQGRISVTQLQVLRTAALSAARAKHENDAADQRIGNPLPAGN